MVKQGGGFSLAELVLCPVGTVFIVVSAKMVVVNDLAGNVLSAVITKGEIAFVSFCPELGVTSQGKTEDEALENLKEAVRLYLEDEDVQEMLRKNPVKPAHFTPFAVPS